MPKFKYDYYTVEVPGDIGESIKDLADIAITEAQERTKLWCVPAIWSATHVSGEIGDFEVVFRVCRKRNA